MGNQIKIFFVFLNTFLMLLQVSAQKSQNFKDAKGYLLYYCIREQYQMIDSNINSPSNKDYSGSYYVQISSLPLQVLDSLHTYYKKNIKNFIGIPKEGSYEPLANMVCWNCFNLIEAKTTLQYIKKILKTYKCL